MSLGSRKRVKVTLATAKLAKLIDQEVAKVGLISWPQFIRGNCWGIWYSPQRAHRITDWVSKLPNPLLLYCWPLAPPETNFNPSCHLNKAAYNTCGEFYKPLFRFISLSGVVSESILWYRKHLWGFSAAFCQVPACEMRLTINIMIYFICCLFNSAPWTHP